MIRKGGTFGIYRYKYGEIMDTKTTIALFLLGFGIGYIIYQGKRIDGLQAQLATAQSEVKFNEIINSKTAAAADADAAEAEYRRVRDEYRANVRSGN